MFNEKSEKWIKIYKTISIVVFWCWVAVGVFAAYDNIAIGNIFDIYIGGYFLPSVVLVLCGIALGYIQLVVSMLIIQFLNNVQTIREKIENN